MDNIHDLYAPVINNAKLESYAECGQRCDVEPECVTWTYVEGICYLKTEDTFKQPNKYCSCGIKNCTATGK